MLDCVHAADHLGLYMIGIKSTTCVKHCCRNIHIMLRIYQLRDFNEIFEISVNENAHDLFWLPS